MRLLKISTIEEANRYADRFIEIHNRKFSREPASQLDAHRPLETQVDLTRVLSRYEERTLTKDAMFQFHSRFYKIGEGMGVSIPKGKKIEIRPGRGSGIRVFLGDKELKVVPIEAVHEPISLIEPEWKQRRFYHDAVKPAHSWAGCKASEAYLGEDSFSMYSRMTSSEAPPQLPAK